MACYFTVLVFKRNFNFFRSPSQSPTLGCSLDSSTSFEGSFIAKGMSSEKDNRILELNEKNIELGRKILDLEENLREKDELIRARTEAVTLMSADFSAKGKSTLDQVGVIQTMFFIFTIQKDV